MITLANIQISQWTNSPNGIFAYQCDFPSNDITSVASVGSDCSQFCVETPECSHYSWTPYWIWSSGGTCYLKKGSASAADAIPTDYDRSVCGLINNVKPVGGGPNNEGIHWIDSPYGLYSLGCDFIGGDFMNVLSISIHEKCGQLCSENPPCNHYSWASVDGGSCWLKNGSVTAAEAVSSSSQSSVCGMFNSTSTASPNSTTTTTTLTSTSTSSSPSPTGLSISWIDSLLCLGVSLS